ncbi:MAG: hypothetical protein HOU81_03295 [Hamadaea sp.]|uniref:hypothetical protein n=1 Tax=Hamadaea sp. TaxID=2024425 RepID=UPI0017DA7475|nr:hypothetical protein [Hamadaea sp.]NUR69821.1 hypothetical protein [Hamadaea sp.]NUT19199.1 hypothetical protein [Hamadaea sp.]
MAVLSRYRTATGAGVLTALVLVLVFGSPWYRNWAADHTNPTTAGGWFLRLLGWPAWRFDSNDTFGDVLADDLKAILLVLLTGLFLMLTTGQQLARARGTLSQFFAGWSAYIFAAAVAALLTAFIRTNPSLLAAFQSAGSGALYGLFTGWIIGIATLGHWRGTS